ncbi:MAG: pilin [Patescibacteria group bacterium]|jgi:hypothetical protein
MLYTETQYMKKSLIFRSAIIVGILFLSCLVLPKGSFGAANCVLLSPEPKAFQPINTLKIRATISNLDESKIGRKAFSDYKLDGEYLRQITGSINGCAPRNGLVLWKDIQKVEGHPSTYIFGLNVTNCNPAEGMSISLSQGATKFCNILFLPQQPGECRIVQPNPPLFYEGTPCNNNEIHIVGRGIIPGQQYKVTLRASRNIQLFSTAKDYGNGEGVVVFKPEDHPNRKYKKSRPTIEVKENFGDMEKICDVYISIAESGSRLPGEQEGIMPRILDEICALVTDQDMAKNCRNCFGAGHVWTALGCIQIGSTDLNSFVGWVIGRVIFVASGIAFLLMVYGAIQIITSSGSPDQVKAGKELITSAIAGLVLIILSLFILRLIGVDILHIPGFSS